MRLEQCRRAAAIGTPTTTSPASSPCPLLPRLVLALALALVSPFPSIHPQAGSAHSPRSPRTKNLVMPPPRGSRPGYSGRSSMLRLLVVASLCCGCCLVVARWGGGALGRSDSGRMAGAATHAGDDLDDDVGYHGGAGAGRRLLSGGPGSHPPRCTSKCGSCTPCAPVHVSVPPGVLVTTEYYPVAWRCKCRDRLYMP